ncbi:MAG: sulfurtransferase TusA family protein [Actinomycetota bacterium]
MPQPQFHPDGKVASDATSPSDLSGGPFVFDGGDLACGELLLGLLRALSRVADGTAVRVIATDPAAPIDIPAWCHLTGHQYLGAGSHSDGRACYHLRYSEGARRTRPGRPWHLDDAEPGVGHDPAPPVTKGTAAS